MKIEVLTPKFVKYIPNELEDGIIYVSKEFSTAIHKCACGCGEKTVTAFLPEWPSGWTITMNGDLVTLRPSIGNQRFPCKSHYWITDNKIVWA